MIVGEDKTMEGLYSGRGVVALVTLVTAWRLWVLAHSGMNLSFDEAQYWTWAQNLTFGYFSKPPMVAWVIALTTALFGEAEWAVKMGASLAHFGTALTLYVLGRDLYGARAGFWTAAVFITLPAVSFSAMVITVDPFLLFFWALALAALKRALDGGGARWWLALGAAVGLGLLSKYAMLFFVLSTAFYLAWSPLHRGLWRKRGPWLALGLALLLLSPNVLWNADHAFLTFAHTKANANLGRDMFHPGKAAEFLGGQFAVFGPLLFGVLLWLFFRVKREAEDERARLLLAFTLPLILIMTIQGFLSRANANWAAPVYVAGSVLVVGWLAERHKWWVVRASVVLHLLAAVAIYNMESLLPLAGYELNAKTDLMKRTRGWDEVGQQVAALRKLHPDDGLLFDARKIMASLMYYIKPHPLDAVMWNEDVRVTNHYEMTTHLSRHLGESFLLVTEEPNADHVAGRFESLDLIAEIKVPIYPGYGREVRVYRAKNFKGYRR